MRLLPEATLRESRLSAAGIVGWHDFGCARDMTSSEGSPRGVQPLPAYCPPGRDTMKNRNDRPRRTKGVMP